MKTIIFVTLLIVVVIIFLFIDKKNQMENRKRPCQFTIRRYNPDNECQPIETRSATGLFHQFGRETQFGSNYEPDLVTVAVVEDETGQIHTVNPNEVKFTDK